MTIREISFTQSIMKTRFSMAEAGTGEPILAFHGNPGSKQDFSYLIPFMDNNKGKLITLDRPGHNGSEDLPNPKHDPFNDSEAYYQLVTQNLKDKIKIVGYSYGAFTACKLAVKHPEIIKELIFISPYLMPENEARSSMPTAVKNTILGTFYGIIKPITAQSSINSFINNTFSPHKPTEEYTDKWFPRFTRFESILASVIDINEMLDSYKEVHEKLKELNIPVKVLFGGQDKRYTVKIQKECIEQIFNNSNITIEDEFGHGIPITEPEYCAKFIGLK